VIGRILGALYAYGMYSNVQRTADIEAFRLQLEWDAMTPEQQERVANARLERKREAAEQLRKQAEQRRLRAEQQRQLFVAAWKLLRRVAPTVSVSNRSFVLFLVCWVLLLLLGAVSILAS
jgi:hypothetical protein